jgi:hypothetical protein
LANPFDFMEQSMTEHVNVASGRKLMRGATPTPRHVLARAKPFVRKAAAIPPYYFNFPATNNMWGNDQYGDCCSAGEAFNKALAGIFVEEADVIAWARKNGVLNGAGITEVITMMSEGGMPSGSGVYGDGSAYTAVDWTNLADLQAAIYEAGSGSPCGSIKVGLAASQLPPGAGNQNGWFLVGAKPDSNEDHCMEYCGYGSAQDFVNAINDEYGLSVTVPSGVDPTLPVLAINTWRTIGCFDAVTNNNIVAEAWMRTQPTTVQKAGTPVVDVVTTYVSNQPSPGPGPSPLPPGPVPAPSPSSFCSSTIVVGLEALLAWAATQTVLGPFTSAVVTEALSVLAVLCPAKSKKWARTFRAQ